VFFAEYPHLGTGSVKVGKKTDRVVHMPSSVASTVVSAVRHVMCRRGLLPHYVHSSPSPRPGNTDPLNLFERYVKT